MAKQIVLKYSGKCVVCGSRLSKGTRAVWLSRGRIECLEHSRKYMEDGEPLGLTYSRYDRYGVYTGDGRKIGSTCSCEDYPCCGH